MKHNVENEKNIQRSIRAHLFQGQCWPYLRIIRPNRHKRNCGHFMIGTNLPKGNENGRALANYELKKKL